MVKTILLTFFERWYIYVCIVFDVIVSHLSLNFWYLLIDINYDNA